MRTPLLLALTATLACHQAAPVENGGHGERAGLRTPPPTEHRLSDDAEAANKARRKAWFRELHQAPPDVDWKAIERRNGLLQVAKRNAIARSHVELSHWVERGSENQAGRMHVACRSSDGVTLYAGSSKGGVWKRAADGSWTPIGDNLYGGAHNMAVVPSATPGNPDVVLATTDGGLIHVSNDDGASWFVPAGLNGNITGVRRVLTQRDGSHTVFVLARHNGQYKLFRSTDRAQSFTVVRNMGGYAGDVWAPRTGGGITIYVLDNGNLNFSNNRGNNWASLGTLPSSTGGELVACEAGAPRFWAVLDTPSQQLYRSDGGASWTHVTAVNDYWGSLNASITDPDLFAWGGVEVHRTTDGGASFGIVNGWGEYYGDPANKLHADIPGIDVEAMGPQGETWFINTDGGLYESQDKLASVQNLSLTGLRVSQYYSTLTSATNPDHVLAGSQDQGFQVSRTPALSSGLRLFDQDISGDYGHLTSTGNTLNWTFMTYPGFILVYRGTNDALYFPDFPAGETQAWLPPVVADPQAPGNFFFLATHLYRYVRSGTTWTPVQWSTQDFQASSGEYLSALEFSPVDDTKVYAATNRGRLFHSSDRGVTWTPSASTGPDAHYFYGTALLADALDADTAYVGGSGYGVPAIYKTTDGGATWQVWDQGLPDTLVYCLGQLDGGGPLFCGTETSAYRRDDGGSWVDITGNEAPVTIYWSVEALSDANTMRFGTYGRGIWDYEVQPSSAAVVYGCGVNPAGSMSILDGTPRLGGSITFGIDNPLGTQAWGAVPILFLKLAPMPGHPCGLVLPSLGMGPAGGELLLSPAPEHDLGDPLVGVIWTPPLPSPITLGIPDNPALQGIQLFVQGMLFEPAASLGVRFGLTDAVELTLYP